MSRDGNWFFGRHFVIVYPMIDFFAVFWFLFDYFISGLYFTAKFIRESIFLS